MTGWQLDLGIEWYSSCATGGLPLGELGQPVGPSLLVSRAAPTSIFGSDPIIVTWATLHHCGH